MHADEVVKLGPSNQLVDGGVAQPNGLTLHSYVVLGDNKESDTLLVVTVVLNTPFVEVFHPTVPLSLYFTINEVGPFAVQLRFALVALILLAVNINLVSFSYFLGDLTGQIFALFVLTVAAAEAAIGLAILVVYNRNAGNIEIENINSLKG